MAYRVGSKLQINTNDGEYIGILHSLDKNTGRLTLNAVTSVDTGKSFKGLLNFYSQDILEAIVLEEKKQDVPQANKNDSGINRPGAKLGYPNMSQQKENYCLSDTSSRLFLEDKQEENTRGSIDTKNRQRNNGKSSAQTEKKEVDAAPEISYILINSYNDAFNEAIFHIQKQAVIGLSAVAVDMGRNGCLCWLAMATNEETFLFDIIQLGEASFTRGLSSILQSGNIQKVVHDCRRLSDLLHHKYSTELVNVFDTQVAYAVIYHNKTGQYPRYVEPLANLLHTTLKLDSSLIHFSKIRMSHALDDQLFWCHRPATEKMLRDVAKDVMHLINLRLELLQLMFADFIQGVDIYLSCVRDIDDDEVLSSQMASQHLLPTEFSKLQARKSKPGCDKNGFRENTVKSCVHFTEYRNNQSVYAENRQGRRGAHSEEGDVSDCNSAEVRRHKVLTPCVTRQCNKGFNTTNSLSDSKQLTVRGTENHLSSMMSVIAAGNEVFYNQTKKPQTEARNVTLPVAKPLCDKEMTFSCIPESVNRYKKQDFTDEVSDTQTSKGVADGLNSSCSSESDLTDASSSILRSRPQTNRPAYTRQHSDINNMTKLSVIKTLPLGDNDGARSLYSSDQLSDQGSLTGSSYEIRKTSEESVTGFTRPANKMNHSQMGRLKLGGHLRVGRGQPLMGGNPQHEWSNSKEMIVNTSECISVGRGKPNSDDGIYHSFVKGDGPSGSVCIGRGHFIFSDSPYHSSEN